MWVRRKLLPDMCDLIPPTGTNWANNFITYVLYLHSFDCFDCFRFILLPTDCSDCFLIALDCILSFLLGVNHRQWIYFGSGITSQFWTFLIVIFEIYVVSWLQVLGTSMTYTVEQYRLWQITGVNSCIQSFPQGDSTSKKFGLHFMYVESVLNCLAKPL